MRKLGIICRNNLYLKQLTDYLPELLGREWVVSGYADEEELAARGAAEELLLVQAPGERRELMKEKLKESGRRILWLSEKRDEGSIFMYQSAEAIAAELLRDEEETESVQDLPAFRVLGYLSAEGGSGCTTAAYRKALELGRRGNTFFLSLDNAPGLSELAGQTAGVSELVYLLKEYGPDWGKHLVHCSCKLGEITAVAGMERLGDALELRASEAEGLVEGLRRLAFGNVVIDFGTSGAEALLQFCDIIYYCGAGAEEKRQSLERQAENGGFLGRLSRLTVSEVNGFDRAHG